MVLHMISNVPADSSAKRAYWVEIWVSPIQPFVTLPHLWGAYFPFLPQTWKWQCKPTVYHLAYSLYVSWSHDGWLLQFFGDSHLSSSHHHHSLSHLFSFPIIIAFSNTHSSNFSLLDKYPTLAWVFLFECYLSGEVRIGSHFFEISRVCRWVFPPPNIPLSPRYVTPRYCIWTFENHWRVHLPLRRSPLSSCPIVYICVEQRPFP